MYSIDLARITLDEFEELIVTTNLSPGRMILTNNLSRVIDKLKQQGIDHLAALQKILHNKKQYPELANELSVSPEYLIVLNREINGYVSKPVPLSKLDVFSRADLDSLAKAGVKSTKDVYELCSAKASRQELAERLNLSEKHLIASLELADLLRINGVGPIYAKILREIGIRGAVDYLKLGSQDILDKYQRVNEEKGYTKAKLGIRDIEYCKRFCKKLDTDVEW
jgi:hypothetical protein